MVEEEVERDALGERAQQAVPVDEGQPLDDLRPHARRALRRTLWPRRGRLFGRAHEPGEEGREQEGAGVEDDDDGGGERLHEHPCEARPDDGDGRGACLQLAVGLHQTLAPHDRRQVGHRAHVAEDGESAREQLDDVEHLDAERAGEVGHWDRGGDEGEREVGAEDHGAAARAVEQHAGEGADEEGGGRARRAEQAHLDGRGLEEDDGRERVGQPSEVTAEEVDVHPQPELEEVWLPPETRRRTFLRRALSLALDLHVHGRLYARAVGRVPAGLL